MYESQLAEAIRATIVHPPTTYSWFGLSSPRLPARVERALTPRTARNHLVYTLRSQLYGDFYTTGRAAPRGWDTRGSAASRSPFVADLSAANVGSGYWAEGWTVKSASSAGEGAELIVERNGLELTVGAGDCSEPPGRGRTVSIRFPKEFRAMSPGFYVACGDCVPAEDEPLVRIYWNLRASGAVTFVHLATSLLNDAGVPFRLKVVNDPGGFSRCDTAVIYLLDRDFARAAELADDIYRKVSRHLDPLTPALTKPLAPGLGFAEDPGGEESFGQHRCRLLAEGIVRAYERRARKLGDRLAVVAERFAEDGIGLDEPYRTASRPRYDSKAAS